MLTTLLAVAGGILLAIAILALLPWITYAIRVVGYSLLQLLKIPIWPFKTIKSGTPKQRVCSLAILGAVALIGYVCNQEWMGTIVFWGLVVTAWFMYEDKRTHRKKNSPVVPG